MTDLGKTEGLPFDPALMGEFIEKQRTDLVEMVAAIMQLETGARSVGLAEIKQFLHTCKGEAAVLGLSDIQYVCHEAENLIAQGYTPVLVDHLLCVTDWLTAENCKLAGEEGRQIESAHAFIRKLLRGKKGSGDEDGDEECRITQGGDVVATVASSSGKDGTAVDVEAGENAARGGFKTREMVKVDTMVLDHILDTIGELVISSTMVQRNCLKDGQPSAAANRNMVQLGKITRELQEFGTHLRMTSVKPLFTKMARLARDVAQKMGKSVVFTREGEDTVIDRSMVELISDPLAHMMRNALDHGIEANQEERIRAGKQPVGRITLRAFHKGGSVHIQIEDDGRGLNRDGILAKALANGLVREGGCPSDEEVWNLIFRPGFSTASVVTDVSGRGVGMEVVKKNVDSLRGRIHIDSRPGLGSTFTITLPLTLAIIEGMIVEAAGNKFIIPTLQVRESIWVTADKFYCAFDKGEMALVHDQIVPVYRMGVVLYDEPREKRGIGELLVIIDDGGRPYGIVVERLLGQQQIVIKTLGTLFRGMKGFAGGAIMADGAVGLILDPASFRELGMSVIDAEVARCVGV